MGDPTFLTTRELADLLRIKERKVYDLVAGGTVPHVKAIGKLLFPRAEVMAWLRQSASGAAPEPKTRANVALGSHDPMLDWAIRTSGCGMAALFNGSLNGLEGFAAGEGILAGLHVHDPATGEWNVALVAERFAAAPVVLVEWARRRRGLVVVPHSGIGRFADIAGRRVAVRQQGAGAQALFEELLAQAGLVDGDFEAVGPAGTESEAALAVLEERADAAIGLESVARQHRLGFLPLIEERFDLLVDRRAWFEPPMQRLLAFCRSDAFAAQAAGLEGYAFDGMGRVRFNGG